jgi:hypothetical protein
VGMASAAIGPCHTYMLASRQVYRHVSSIIGTLACYIIMRIPLMYNLHETFSTSVILKNHLQLINAVKSKFCDEAAGYRYLGVAGST